MKEYTEILVKFNEIEAINSKNIAIGGGARFRRFVNTIMDCGMVVSPKQPISTESWVMPHYQNDDLKF